MLITIYDLFKSSKYLEICNGLAAAMYLKVLLANALILEAVVWFQKCFPKCAGRYFLMSIKLKI